VRLPDELRKAEHELREAIGLLGILLQSGNTIELQVDCSCAHLMLGLALSNQGNPIAAIQESTIAARYALGESRDDPDPASQIPSLVTSPMPGTPVLAIAFANAMNNLSIDLLSVGRGALALECVRRAVSTGEALNEGGSRKYLPDLARYLNNLSHAQTRRKEASAALDSSRRSVSIRAILAATRPDEFALPFALSLENLLGLEEHEKDWAAAQATARRTVRAYKELFMRDPAHYAKDLIRAQRVLARFCRKCGDVEEAANIETSVDRALEEEMRTGRILAADAVGLMRNPLPTPTPALHDHALRLDEQSQKQRLLEAGNLRRVEEVRELSALGRSLHEGGEFPAALDHFGKALGILEEILGADDPRLASFVENVGVVLWDMGRPEEAVVQYERAARLFGLGDSRPDDIALLRCNMAESLIALGRLREARPALEAALQYFESAFGRDHEGTIIALRLCRLLEEAEGKERS
jgi:tetratricopeptide (TPR) repeat protein